MLDPDFEWIWKAFVKLGTTRSSGMSIGQIPYHRVTAYGDRLGLDYDTTEFMWEVVHRVDLKYLALMRDKAPSK